jgi:hypothetical protein
VIQPPNSNFKDNGFPYAFCFRAFDKSPAISSAQEAIMAFPDAKAEKYNLSPVRSGVDIE